MFLKFEQFLFAFWIFRISFLKYLVVSYNVLLNLFIKPVAINMQAILGNKGALIVFSKYSIFLQIQLVFLLAPSSMQLGFFWLTDACKYFDTLALRTLRPVYFRFLKLKWATSLCLLPLVWLMRVRSSQLLRDDPLESPFGYDGSVKTVLWGINVPWRRCYNITFMGVYTI